MRQRLAVALLAVFGLALAGCSSSDAAGDKLTLGYFPNLTHAPALVGVEQGLFEKELTPLGVELNTVAFNAGPEAVNALFANSVDIAYVGPNPTVTSFVQSKGEAISVIAGSTSGGAALVVRPGINSPEDLKGKSIATPQLGNTQDVALRNWLKDEGLTATIEGGGDVSIKPQANSEGLVAYETKAIDGAWVPEPFVAQYVQKGAKVLVDEKSLWPDGKFVTTNVVVRKQFLEQHPDIVEAFLRGHVAALQEINKDAAKGQTESIAGIKAITGKELDAQAVKTAWPEMEFTADPLKSTLDQSAKHAIAVGLLEQGEYDDAGDINSMYDLTLLNKVLAANGDKPIQ